MMSAASAKLGWNRFDEVLQNIWCSIARWLLGRATYFSLGCSILHSCWLCCV